MFPKAIFVAAGSFAFAAFIFLSLTRPDAGIQVRRRVPRRLDDCEVERGRVSKDIRKSGARVAVVPVEDV